MAAERVLAAVIRVSTPAMRTDAEDVFAVGDCALKRDFFTRKAAPVWLASTATAEARNAGTNIYGIRVLHQIQGTVAAFSTQIGGKSFASAGMTCRTCEKERVSLRYGNRRCPGSSSRYAYRSQ